MTRVLRIQKNIQFALATLFLIITQCVFAQQVDIEKLGSNFRKPVRVGGGVGLNTIFYNGNDGQGRQPFTYLLNGNVNFNFFNQINVPFTFNITNLGNSYTLPTSPNRLAIHPKYKWITAHIGDIAMSFSPYTLNGHMFRGVGLDLTPNGGWKISAMGGLLQRSVECNPANPLIPAAYARTGYGVKVRHDESNYYLGMTYFNSKEDPNSLRNAPDSLGIFPKANTAVSWEGGLKLGDHVNVSGEYAMSFLTRDVRASREGTSVTDNLLDNRTSTHAYRAYRFDVNYRLMKNSIGIGYERIDPEYATLGAYYFNNDYENVTLRYARPFLKDKMNLATSWGVQHDDLNHNQQQSTKRFVSSANLNYAPNEKLNMALSYSSFQSYMNIRSQFRYINGQTPYDNLDTLNYTQLSQNMNLNTNYNFGRNEKKKHNLNVSLSFQEAANKQGNIIRPGNLTQFYNGGLSYMLLLVPQAISMQAAFNTTYNKIGADEYLTLGPTAGVNAKLLKKKLTARVSSSYNVATVRGEVQTKVWNLRGGATYIFLKRHNLSLNTIWQKRSYVARRTTESLTITFGYSFIF